MDYTNIGQDPWMWQTHLAGQLKNVSQLSYPCPTITPPARAFQHAPSNLRISALPVTSLTISNNQTRSEGAKIGVLDSRGAEVIKSFDEFCARLGVGGWVRLHPDDYSALSALETEFVHFNLEVTDNSVGRRYAIVPILRAGKRRADGTEQLPIVDMAQHRAAICTEVIQRLPLDRVTAEQFHHSLPSIRSAADLEKALIARYSPMFPDATAEDIAARGAALSRFRFVEPDR